MRLCLGIVTLCFAAVSLGSDLAAGEIARCSANTPNGWASVGAPSEESITCANWTLRSWRLEPRPGLVPAIVPNDELVPRQDLVPFPFHCPFETEHLLARRVALDVGREWLVGCDLGTHGGGLWVVSAAGHKETKLWNERVWEITTIGDRVLVLSQDGNGELGLILEIAASDGVWRARALSKMPGYPIGAVQRDDGVIVITTAGLFSVIGDQVSALSRFDLSGLLPTSALSTDSGEIYVAMRHFALRLRQVSGRWVQDWLAPVDCQSFRKRDERPCDCVLGIGGTLVAPHHPPHQHLRP